MLDTTPFHDDPPFDAQYVGTFQPLFGWAGRTGVRHVEVAVARLFDEVTAQVAVPPPPGDTRPGSLDGFAPWGQATVHRRDWGVRLMQRIQPTGDRRRTAPARAAAAIGEAMASLRRRLSSDGAAAVVRSVEPRNGDDANLTWAREQTAAAVEFLARSPGFGAVLGASVQESAQLADDLADWIDELDVARDDLRLILSPIGLLNLYREYYFDFGTRLGPPVEHLWIAPGSDVEITESYSRTDYSFVEVERSFEEASSTEAASTEAETFAEEVERAQQRDISVGVAAQVSGTFPVYQFSASASFDYANSLTESRRQALERTREVSTKVSKQMRRSSRALTRASTETMQSSVRRHRITNPSGEVRNLEMRRKLQHVGVQVQHLGTSLCWQRFVSAPGDALHLPELIHVGADEDFMSTPAPDDATVTLPPKTTDRIVTIQFTPVRLDRTSDTQVDNTAQYVRSADRHATLFDPATPVYVATKDGVDPTRSNDIIQAEFTFHEAPTDGYTLDHVTAGAARGTSADHDQPSRWSIHTMVVDGAAGSYLVFLDLVNFEKQPAVDVTMTFHWAPPPPAAPPGAAAAAAEHTQAMQRKARQAMADALEERVTLSSQIRRRHPDDLRAEERAVVYRRMIVELIGGSVGSELYLLAEKIRTIFDVDRMLYFVAPDWWRPTAPPLAPRLPDLGARRGSLALSERDKTRFHRDSLGRPNYLITEESEPAPLGRSLGWLIQLDGDDLRNVFLNAPWVKAVLPIRPGQEAAAIAFLRQSHVEGADGLDARPDSGAGPAEQTLEEQLLALAGEIRRHNDPDAVYTAGQLVYENGFQPVEGRVRLTDRPLDVFAEWVEVVPTRQVVPVTYQPPARFRPVPPEAPPALEPPGPPVG